MVPDRGNYMLFRSPCGAYQLPAPYVFGLLVSRGFWSEESQTGGPRSPLADKRVDKDAERIYWPSLATRLKARVPIVSYLHLNRTNTSPREAVDEKRSGATTGSSPREAFRHSGSYASPRYEAWTDTYSWRITSQLRLSGITQLAPSILNSLFVVRKIQIPSWQPIFFSLNAGYLYHCCRQGQLGFCPNKVFVDLCVEQLKEGRRPGSHFTKEGWQKIVAGFFDKTGKRYDQPQFKNKWDNLKKEYKLWKKLRIHDTGTGWDNVRNTILADNDWWERRIQEDKKVAKFRIQGPENLEQLETLFDGIMATGEFAFFAGASNENAVNHNDQMRKSSIGENVDSLHISSDYSPDPEFDINIEQSNEVTSSPTPPLRQVRRRSGTSGTRGKKKRRASASDYREDISKSLGNLVSTVNSRSHSIASTPVSGAKAEIAECMRILEEIPETAEMGDLLLFALKLFHNKDHREYFTAMLRRDWQLAWLKMMYEDAQGGGAGGSK
ncbi:L10-interacting MYB domain-containing protein-like [Tripterygium wilfordii]|uniref:L10-interacting MYB domain-containing protein-like n=1 Tax=Tripterygium wilfordii TaxID=458696 RepID=UPI0018F8236C|nr:L10-interacting MYB domain-containing protein-like [Tripterygium wilfordii]